MQSSTAHVPLPKIEFIEGTPTSTQFDDVYFSRRGGVAETEHVFLVGNGLPQRWCVGTAEPRSGGGQRQGRVGGDAPFNSPRVFTIGELGFGTGLNFLVTLKHFRAAADAAAHLHYIAVEKFPLTTDMLRNALALQPELTTEAAELIAAYPLRLPGIHRIHLPRVTLTLCYGDAVEMLRELEVASRSADGPHEPEGQGSASNAREGGVSPPSSNHLIKAWFLDGFAPAKNAEMWSAEVFAHIGRLSAPDATFATFTAAGAVKRGLAEQGFTVSKVAGYGHKRDMLVGRRESKITHSPPSRKGEGALVLGAGIAGATLARALAERGYTVTVLDRGPAASGASGNPAGVLFPQLSKRWTPAAAWYFTAYNFALRQLARWREQGLNFNYAQPGMLRLPRHAEEEAQLRALNATLGLDPTIAYWVEREVASEHAGTALATGGAWFPQGTWLSPPSLINALLSHSNITLHTGETTSLTREGGEWIAQTANGVQFAAPTCCIATAAESLKLLPDASGIKLHAVAGQVSRIAADDVAAPLKTILCHKGYVIPAGGDYLIGATYNHDDPIGAVTDENHRKNIAEVETFLPGWVRGDAVDGRTSFRATTPNRLPYVGALGEGLYISAGHGSRGLLSAPLAAEVIASQIAGEVVPLTAALRVAISPQRFQSMLSASTSANPSRANTSR